MKFSPKCRTKKLEMIYTDQMHRLVSVFAVHIYEIHVFSLHGSYQFHCSRQGISYLSEVRARGLLKLGKKAFGSSNWKNLNWTAILKGLKTIKKKRNSTNLYPPRKGYLREICKSQNINAIFR